MPYRLLAAACVLAFLTAPAPPDTPSKQLPPVPGKQLPIALGRTELSLSSGAAMGPPSYLVKLHGDRLTYQAKAYDPAVNKVVETNLEIKPTPEQWSEFWKSMDEVGLWNWKPVYRDPNIFDGHHWGVVAAHDGRAIQSMGGNLYPGQDPVAKVGENRPAISPLFDKYLAAVRKLIGDRQFR